MSVFGGFSFYQSGSNSSAADAASAGSSAREAMTNVGNLQREVHRLEMICEAMWELIKERGSFHDDDLMAKLAELDLSDGKADGRKAESGPAMCPKCNRPNSRRHDYCIYCGQMIRTSPF
jgi:hypothetical protein